MRGLGGGRGGDNLFRKRWITHKTMCEHCVSTDTQGGALRTAKSKATSKQRQLVLLLVPEAGTPQSHFREGKGCQMGKKWNQDPGLALRKKGTMAFPLPWEQEAGAGRQRSMHALRHSSSTSLPIPLEAMSPSLPLTNIPPLLTGHSNLFLCPHFQTDLLRNNLCI